MKYAAEWADWTPSDEQQAQIESFITDMRGSGLDFTEFKKIVTFDQGWSKYDKIHKVTIFQNKSNNKQFGCNGLKGFAYKAMRKAFSYESSSEWRVK